MEEIVNEPRELPKPTLDDVWDEFELLMNDALGG